MLLVDFARELGLPMNGLAIGNHYGWTTDEAKAKTMEGAGARIEFVPAARGRWQDDQTTKFDGWQIVVPVGAEVASGVDS